MNLSGMLRFVAMLACSAAICVGTAISQQKSNSLPKPRAGFDVNAIDKSVDPCVDFYHYACGTWLRENPIPPDRASYGRSSELGDRNLLILKDVLEKASAPSAGRSANEQKIGDRYASCMDEPRSKGGEYRTFEASWAESKR